MKKILILPLILFGMVALHAEVNYRQQPLRITAKTNGVTMNIVCHVDLDKPIEVVYDVYNKYDSLLCRYIMNTPQGDAGRHMEKRGFIIGDTLGSILDWMTLEQGEHQPTLPQGGYVLVYGDNPDGIGSGTFTRERHLTMNFQSGLVDLSGNIMSLIVGDDSDRLDTAQYIPRDVCFARLFNHNNSDGGSDAIMNDITAGPVDASHLIMPADSLRHACYDRMFNSCNMLTKFPDLPATKMAEYCYLQTFGGCYAATAAPFLGAKEMAGSCFRHMFQDCKSLRKAPDLLATEISSGCMYGMYDGCIALKKVRVQFTDWHDGRHTTDWLKNVAATGTFVCPTALAQTFGDNYIPEGWTIEIDDNILNDTETITTATPHAEKYLQNGRLMIQREGCAYDVLGRKMN